MNTASWEPYTVSWALASPRYEVTHIGKWRHEVYNVAARCCCLLSICNHCGSLLLIGDDSDEHDVCGGCSLPVPPGSDD